MTLKKQESFNNQLEKFIKNKGEVTNIELYHFTYEHGHISDHTNEHLRELKRRKNIIYSGHIRISWESVKWNKITKFKWL